MAENQEIILEINVQGSIENLAQVRQSMDRLIEQREELSEKSKKGDLEATKALEQLNSTIRNTQVEYKAQQRVLDGYLQSKKNEVNTSNLAANSIQTNRDLLKQLTAQYIQLKNPSANATGQLKELTRVLKQQEAAIGDNRRNVGNYAGDLAKFFGGGGAIGNVVNGLGIVSQSIGGISGQLGVLKTALLTSGVGALVVGIGAVATYFKAFEEGSELLERKMAGLRGAADFTIAAFGRFGKSIVDSLGSATQKSFGENVGSLATILKEGLVEQAKGVADTYRSLFKLISTFGKEGGADLQDAILRAVSFGKVSRKSVEDFASATNNARKQAEDFAGELQVIDDLERERAKQISANQVQIDVLRAKAKVKGADDTALLKQAQDLEKQNLELELKTAEARLDIIVKQTNIRREQGTVTEKVTVDELAAFQKVDNAKRSSLALIEKINNQILASEQEREAKLQQFNERVEARQKAEDDAFVAKLNKEASENRKALEQLRVNAELQIELQKETGETQEQIDKEFQESGLASFKEFVDKKRDIYNKDVDNAKEAAKKKQAVQEAELEFSSTVSQGLIGFISSVAEATGASAEFSKVLAVVEIATQAAIALATGIASSQDLPYPGNLVAMGTTIAAVLGAIGSAVAILSKAPATPKPGFAHGVIGIDGDGDEQSDSIPAMLSKNESVMTAKATKRFHRELAAMEIAVGNKPNYKFGSGRFATGFIPNLPQGDGGFVNRDIARNSDTTAFMKQAIIEGFAKAPAPVLSIVELQAKQDSRNRSISISEA